MKRLILLSLLLTGCQSQFIKLAETPGEYPPPITKDKYLLTAWNWYIDRNIKIDDSIITYSVIIDNRELKRGLMAKYTPTERFKKQFPWFIRHKGKVDCEKKNNNSTIIFFDEKLDKALKEIPEAGMNEVASALCLINELSK